MSDSFVQLPYTATTSGQILDSESLTVGANTVLRERMQITGASATQIAPVTSSGGLLVTLSTVPGYLVTLSSNPVASQIVSLSSGTVTLSSAPTVNVSSGVITITSGTVTGVYVTGTSGGTAVVTTSGGLQVELTNAGGSTAVNVIGSTGTALVITSAGVAEVQIASSGGINAPVTSSAGLKVVLGTTATLTAQITTTLGAPVTQSLTTAALWLYSLMLFSTAGTAGNAIAVFSATSALSTQTDPKIRLSSPAVGTNFQAQFTRGMYFPNGLQVTDSLTFGTTGTNTMGVGITVEYEV